VLVVSGFSQFVHQTGISLFTRTWKLNELYKLEFLPLTQTAHDREFVLCESDQRDVLVPYVEICLAHDNMRMLLPPESAKTVVGRDFSFTIVTLSQFV